jgi:DNA-binding NarL/FixJ family response regulator
VVLTAGSRLLREAVAELLRRNGFDVVAGAPGELAGLVAAARPALAVADISGLDGVPGVLDLRRNHPEVGVLLLSDRPETGRLADLVGGAARGIGYLLTDRVCGTEFLDAVRQVAAGGCAIDPDIVAAMLDGSSQGGLHGLTPREREVLALMARGRSNPAIATQLHLTARTVETHIRNIFQRLALPAEWENHRRVLAVLAYLRAHP